MPKKNEPQQIYKTETQLKEEARAKQAAESEAAAKEHKTEFQKKRENYWYHYKWQTIAGIFGAFLLIFFIKDMFFRTKPDATIVVVSSGFVSAEALESMALVLEEFATDFNEDGKIMISTDYISLPNFDGENTEPEPDLTGGQADMGNAMKLMAIIAAGAEPIYLLDEASYKYLVTMGQGDNPNPEDSIFEEFSIPVGSGNIDHDGAEELIGMKLYLRTAHSDENYYEYCKQLLEAVAENSQGKK